MFDQQVESISNKLVQFIQNLTVNIQTIHNTTQINDSVFELFQLRSDYARQLATLFDMLVNKIIDEFLVHRVNRLALKLDAVQIWRSIQCCIDQLTAISSQNLCMIIQHLRTVKDCFYNLLLQLKNVTHLHVDLTRVLKQNLQEELNCLATSLLQFTKTFCCNSQTNNNIRPQSYSTPANTYLFQSASFAQSLTQVNPVNSTSPYVTSLEKSGISPAINSNCCSSPITKNPSSIQRIDTPNAAQSANIHLNINRCCTQTIPTASSLGCCGSAYQEILSPTIDTASALCVTAPVVYSPEIENLLSSGGIIYVRKAGNAWISENLGSLVTQLQAIGKDMDMNEHYKIFIRKNGELVTQRRPGYRKMRPTKNQK